MSGEPRRVELALLIEHTIVGLRMLSVHAHELSPQQRAEVYDATEVLVDRVMQLQGFVRVEDLRELFE